MCTTLVARLLIGILAASLVESLVGCASSPPSHFFALTAIAPGATADGASAAAALAPLVRVAAVHIPPMLDREQIVRRGPGNELEISGLDRWGSPLDEMIQRILTEDLLERLPAGRVVLPSSPAPPTTDQIVVDILQFQSDAGGTVIFDGSWSLLAPAANRPSLIRHVRYSDTAKPGDYGDQAAAMSRLLGQLADDIVRSLPQR
jgi:uncharacterized protein